jgi:hypothetical protein
MARLTPALVPDGTCDLLEGGSHGSRQPLRSLCRHDRQRQGSCGWCFPLAKVRGGRSKSTISAIESRGEAPDTAGRSLRLRSASGSSSVTDAILLLLRARRGCLLILVLCPAGSTSNATTLKRCGSSS